MINTTIIVSGLNPCCNGRGSKTLRRLIESRSCLVLILVVMEEGRRLPGAETVLVGLTVLILVVMEEGRRHVDEFNGHAFVALS